MMIDAFAGSMCCTLIIYFVHHCIKIFNLSLSTSMDPVFQHHAKQSKHDDDDAQRNWFVVVSCFLFFIEIED